MAYFTRRTVPATPRSLAPTNHGVVTAENALHIQRRHTDREPADACLLGFRTLLPYPPLRVRRPRLGVVVVAV